MKRRMFIRSAGLAATGVSLTLAGCSGSNSGTDPAKQATGDTETSAGQRGSSATGQPAEKEHKVEMQQDPGLYYFNPIGLLVQPGDTVTFVANSDNQSSTAYENRIPEGANAWDSGVLAEAGTTFEHTFEVPGTYDFYSKPHENAGMVARIVCSEPGGPAETNPPEAGQVPPSSVIMQKGYLSYILFKGLCCGPSSGSSGYRGGAVGGSN